MLSVLIPEGFPLEAQEILSTAIEEAFGGAATIEEVPREKLKTKVRLSSRNVNVPLVVLDEESAEYCQEVENGLYDSEKYMGYKDMPSFVTDLNNRFELNLEVPEEKEAEESLNIFSNVEDAIKQDEVERLLAEKDAAKDAIVRTKDRKIAELEARVKELEIFQYKYEQLEDAQFEREESGSQEESELGNVKTVSKEDYDTLLRQNSELQGNLMDLQSDLSNANSRIAELEKEISDSSVSDSKLAKNFEIVRKELAELKNTYTQQSSLLKKKEERIGILTKEVDDERSSRQNTENSIAGLSDTITALREDLASAKSDITIKDRELNRLYKELSIAKSKEVTSDLLEEKNTIIEDLKSELENLTNENAEYQRTVESLGNTIENQKQQISKAESKYSKLEGELKEKEDKVTELSETVNDLNKNLIEVTSKLEYFEKESSGSENESSIEYMNLKKELTRIKGSIYYKLSEENKEDSRLDRVDLLPDVPPSEKIPNIWYVFSSGNESIPGTYKNLDFLIRPLLAQKYKVLVVDLFFDTSIDKGLDFSKLASGSSWFKKGGNVQSYLMPTSRANVKLLGVGASYINELFLLGVKWESRLRELSKSGYMVIMYCGSLTSMLGRIMHLSFAHHGESFIFAKASSWSALRPLIASSVSIKNFSYSRVWFFDYVEELAYKFKDSIEQTNKTRILTSRPLRR